MLEKKTAFCVQRRQCAGYVVVNVTISPYSSKYFEKLISIINVYKFVCATLKCDMYDTTVIREQYRAAVCDANYGPD